MKVTLLITTYNRPELLERSLWWLRRLTPPDELIVVNDGGDRDHSAHVVSAYLFDAGVTGLYLYNNNPGPTICSHARNVGVRRASNDWIITSEPELIFITDVVAQFKELHVDHPDQVISTGRVYFQPEAHASGAEVIPQSDWEIADGWVAPHAALYKRNWLREVGGWDETFPGPWGWDDTDLLTRLRIAGHGQYIAREVHGLHQWHPLGGDAGSQNEAHFLAKSFNHDPADLRDLVANQDREWGRQKVLTAAEAKERFG